jgi:hypothetical protein
MYKKFYNKRRDNRFSREYELNKYEYLSDLEFDLLKLFEELTEEEKKSKLVKKNNLNENERVS